MLKFRSFTIILITSVFLLLACGKSYFFEETFTVPNSEWAYGDNADFTFMVEDTSAIYNLILQIEHSTEYEKQNLYVKIHTGFPKGEKREDIISFDLADKVGKWAGKCSSSKCTATIDLQKGAFFSQQGMHTISIEQFMRDEKLAEVHSIRLIVEQTDNKK